MAMTNEDRQRLARFILNTWALGESLEEQLRIDSENVDPNSEYEIKEHRENMRVLNLYRERAETVLGQLEDLVAFAL